jgi:hypothetical protein
MSWIQVTSSQTLIPGATSTQTRYRVAVQVDLAQGIEKELFVYRLTDQGYSHVARYEDLNLYPADAATAQANDLLFYRRADVELSFSTEAAASSALRELLAALSGTNKVWGRAAAAPFGGVQTVVYDSEDA